MTAIKEKIMGAVTVMSDTDAEAFWKIILERFSVDPWDNIKEETPDEIDLQMLKSINADPDCHEFTRECNIDWNQPD